MENGVAKRHYSVTEEDKNNLLRVLAGFSRKGKSCIDEEESSRLLNLCIIPIALLRRLY